MSTEQSAPQVDQPRSKSVFRWVLLIALVTFFAGLLFGYDQGVIAGALKGIGNSFQVGDSAKQIITSWVTLGALVAALVAGMSADRFGRRRVLLARSLVHRPKVLLLDEPLIAVDAETRTVLAAVMDELRGRGRTLLVATHYVSGLATEFYSVVFLSEGRVVSAAVAPPQHAPLMAAAHPQ